MDARDLTESNAISILNNTKLGQLLAIIGKYLEKKSSVSGCRCTTNNKKNPWRNRLWREKNKYYRENWPEQICKQ